MRKKLVVVTKEQIFPSSADGGSKTTCIRIVRTFNKQRSLGQIGSMQGLPGIYTVDFHAAGLGFLHTLARGFRTAILYSD